MKVEIPQLTDGECVHIHIGGCVHVVKVDQARELAIWIDELLAEVLSSGEEQVKETVKVRCLRRMCGKVREVQVKEAEHICRVGCPACGERGYLVASHFLQYSPGMSAKVKTALFHEMLERNKRCLDMDEEFNFPRRLHSMSKYQGYVYQGGWVRNPESEGWRSGERLAEMEANVVLDESFIRYYQERVEFYGNVTTLHYLSEMNVRVEGQLLAEIAELAGGTKLDGNPGRGTSVFEMSDPYKKLKLKDIGQMISEYGGGRYVEGLRKGSSLLERLNACRITPGDFDKEINWVPTQHPYVEKGK